MSDWILGVIGLSPRDFSLGSDSESFHSADSRPQSPAQSPRHTLLRREQTEVPTSHGEPQTQTHGAKTEARTSAPATPPPACGNTPHSPVSTPRQKRPRSPDEIVIPTIFLTQGARNSRLLKQGEEIARQLGEDEARAARERDRLDRERRAVLAELNTNGLDFVYSMKTDAALVDSYVEKAFAGHDSVRAARHFYFFRDVKPSPCGVVRELEVFFARAGGRAALAQLLVQRQISPTQLVRHVVAQVYDDATLDMVADVVGEAVGGEGHREVEEPNQASDWTLPRALGALGAELHTGENTGAINLTLKYVHYNTATGALVRRLEIVLVYFARRVTASTLASFVTAFILGALDFALNKYERAVLVRAMGRVLCALAARARAIGLSPPELLAPFRSFFARAECRLFGDSAVVPQKNHELHYNFLRNMVASRAEKPLVHLLATEFLGAAADVAQANGLPHSPPPGVAAPELISVPVLARVAADIARPDLARAPARIFSGLYRAQLAAFLVPALLADALAPGLVAPEKAAWRALHTKVLEAKDNLQQAVGTLLYMAIEDTPDKVALSKALGETYSAFDHLSVVLDKNLAYFRTDLFYDSP